MYGTTIGVSMGDTRSFDYGSRCVGNTPHQHEYAVVICCILSAVYLLLARSELGNMMPM